MERRPTTGGRTRKSSGRLKSLLWIAGVTILVIVLMYLEQTAILYVVATLSVTVLLIIIAFADLHGRSADTSELGNDAAAISDGLTGASAAGVAAQAAPARRAAAKRKQPR